ncbi:hypothetical protein C5B85_01885 [Pseudoclavibacter sp. AY1F1]|uniref:hypothetical protein n=1 Tax=Pseudoclavibacter sp. AY1F1 TaxID=2080583 RepID=UPI000CE7C1ED|nr:hypothetical protein [Pseudoclavibacter sp. AY1F1]PPF47050.1 hypothetical protein C5B85_01885 [Pseudoclavibacter sp. AY1F1]
MPDAEELARLQADAQKIEDRRQLDDDEGPDPDDTSSPEEGSSEALAAVRLRVEKRKLKQRAQDMKLRKNLAYWAIGFVCAQLVFANLFFAIYLGHNAVRPNPAIMIAWLSGTVVEVIGILWVIARSLFPFKDKSRSKASEKNPPTPPAE